MGQWSIARLVRVCCWISFGIATIVRAQDVPAQSPPADDERWNLYFQATSIGQYHPSFDAPYTGRFSLINHPEAEVSITSTLFFGWRIAHNTQFYFDPEMAGGRGFSATNGIANFPNGEMPRVATAAPKPYVARLYVTQDFGFGDGQEQVESDENQLAGSRPMTRYSITLGRFTVTDFFDNNRYTHDPRTQFMGWAVMYNGAWDYPADTRGYTWGWVHEFHTRRWSLRYGSSAMPKVANGLRFDRRLFRDRADMFEGELHFHPGGHDGAIRLLSYQNHADAGTYGDAIRLARQSGTTPDITATRRIGTLKYGFGISAEQEIVKDVGVFGRLGWNDGKTESFAFTAIDRLATAGVSVGGGRWRRPHDTAATEVTVNGLSAVHAQYLALGGYDFLIGDGKLRYGPEVISESYYSAQLWPWLAATIDLQHVNNPAYNRDRGPVWVGTFRLHLEMGKK
ncbi:MAG TPA: carbohydrate porin [Bryobacteraceae bacterium]|nr:carbohydrate porin [Bryobacteraceae bacterium]